MITVLGIIGSMRWPSHTHTMMEVALRAARESGSRVELLDVRTLDLPLFDPRLPHPPPAVQELRERIADAHAYLVGTPEYHGAMSGALKNIFDYLYPEVSGKLFGCMVATGSDLGTAAMINLRTTISYLHGWVLPYAVSAARDQFDEGGHLVDMRTRDRLYRLGRDVVVYGRMLNEQFVRDAKPDGGPDLGFAAWHARAA